MEKLNTTEITQEELERIKAERSHKDLIERLENQSEAQEEHILR